MSQSVQRRLDEVERAAFAALAEALTAPVVAVEADEREIGRASCRERVYSNV